MILLLLRRILDFILVTPPGRTLAIKAESRTLAIEGEE